MPHWRFPTRWMAMLLSMVSASLLAAELASEPPIVGSSCRPGQLVDAPFRDAALAALDRLIVQAPGKAAEGAVRTHHSAGHIDKLGKHWHQVTAYQVNLGLMGALRVSPRLLPVVAKWLGWQARHMATRGATQGVVLDHWVREGDFYESACPPDIAVGLCDHVDAFDSTAASTLLMADAYLRYGGQTAVLREPAMRQALESAAAALRALTVADGLTIAKPDHRVVYTMDSAEVAAGWRAWARLQRDAYAEPQSAVHSFTAATNVVAGMRARLWDAKVGAWRVSLDAGSPQRNRWYPDTVAQAWPMLWGGEFGSTGQAAVWRQAILPWQGASHWAQSNVDPEGFWWPSIAVAAHCTGDAAAANTWVARARRSWLNPKTPFAWPFQVGDLLWLMWLAEPQRSTSATP